MPPRTTIYNIFLASMCCVALGIVMLQLVANPYVMVLGTPEKGAFRMTLSQASNSVATTLAPMFITYFIIAGKSEDQLSGNDVTVPFLGLGIFTFLLCIILYFLKLPEIKEEEQAAGQMVTHENTNRACSNTPTYGSVLLPSLCIWDWKSVSRPCCPFISTASLIWAVKPKTSCCRCIGAV